MKICIHFAITDDTTTSIHFWIPQKKFQYIYFTNKKNFEKKTCFRKIQKRFVTKSQKKDLDEKLKQNI